MNEIIAQSSDSDFSIIPVGVKGYTWTAGLNAPAAILHKLANEHGIDESNISLLNQSFDVEMSDEQVGKMAERIREGKFVFTLRTATGEATSDEIESYIKIALPVILDKDLSEKDRMQYLKDHPELVAMARNTSALVSLKDIVELGGYTPSTNLYGGMEDHEFWVRLLHYVLKKQEKSISEVERDVWEAKKRELLAFRDRDAYVTYRDPAWEGSSDDSKQTKRDREIRAQTFVSWQIGIQATENLASAFIVPKEKRDFAF